MSIQSFLYKSLVFQEENSPQNQFLGAIVFLLFANQEPHQENDEFEII